MTLSAQTRAWLVPPLLVPLLLGLLVAGITVSQW
jgi:hypothetical protein